MREYLPAENTIVLDPSNDENVWRLTFLDEQSGERVRLLLPLEQLEEMDAEFTGHIPGPLDSRSDDD